MNKLTEKKELREFGLILGFGLPIIFGFLLPFLFGHSFRYWTLWLGFSLICFAILYPIFLFYPYKIWMKVGYVLGWINSYIILGLIFMMILFPLSLIMKLFNYDPLRIKKVNLFSYRENKKDQSINLNKPF